MSAYDPHGEEFHKPWRPEVSTPEGDPVVLPHHYARFKIEPVTFIMENKIAFAPGNVIKYVCRHDAKNGLEDLRKARRYLDLMIRQLEGKPVDDR